jgi:hypothetical protein
VTRDLHFLNKDGMVACNPRDREAAHRAEVEGIATEHVASVTCRKCRAVLWSTGKQADPVREDAEPSAADYFQPRIMRHFHADGSVEYAIHDVYFKSNGSVDGCTAAARSPRTLTVHDLKSWVQNAADRGVPVVCGDLGYTHRPEHFTHWLKHIDHPPLDYCNE